MRKWLGLVAAALAISLTPSADAFCGFYVGGADAKLFNNATLVVLMRDGTRTVLSMQNNYQGPPSNFAMVVPVPIVLQKENVKTLPPDVFDRVDKLAAPRLVEYWEQDPCWVPPPMTMRPRGAPVKMSPPSPQASPRSLGVKIEAQFEVGEYEIVILSARDSTGLDTWLKQEKYNIPEGAEPVLRPYVQQGMKFFVAKVNAKKVTFKDDRAMLSPLRFHYDTELFALPVRLGMLNSNGKQDLIVHILAPERYEVANFDNVTIPTNFDVSPRTKEHFGEFYAALFDEVQKRHPGAVVTEYAWQATGCDPCPGPPLAGNDFATLGADALPSLQEAASPDQGGPTRWKAPPGSNFVLTRLHARYDKNALGEDLVFKKASAIVGGREMQDDKGKIERSAKEDSFNNFQGRYVIRHEWTGAIRCANPVRGRWGGPPDGVQEAGPRAAQDLAFAPRGRVPLKQFVSFDVTGQGSSLSSKGSPMGLEGSIGKGAPGGPDDPEPNAVGSATPPSPVDPAGPGTAGTPPQSGGCGACNLTSSRDHYGWSALVWLGAWLARRRRS